MIKGLSMKKERIAMATKSVMKRNLINVTGLISSSLGMDFGMGEYEEVYYIKVLKPHSVCSNKCRERVVHKSFI